MTPDPALIQPYKRLNAAELLAAHEEWTFVVVKASAPQTIAVAAMRCGAIAAILKERAEAKICGTDRIAFLEARRDELQAANSKLHFINQNLRQQICLLNPALKAGGLDKRNPEAAHG